MAGRTLLSLAAFAALLLLPLPAGASPTTPDGAGTLVDRVIATVDDVPITASEVALEAAIRSRVQDSREPESFGLLLSEQSEPLEAVILRNLLRTQPGLPNIRPTGAEAQRRLRLFEDGFETREEVLRWRLAWGLERSLLLEYFKESVALDKLVELSVTFRITEEEQRSYYEQNRDRVYGGRPFEEVAADVTQRVYSLKFRDEYNSWCQALRSRATLRYIARDRSTEEDP